MEDTMSAPWRIWAWIGSDPTSPRHVRLFRDWSHREDIAKAKSERCSEYVRADIHARVTAERDAAIAALAEETARVSAALRILEPVAEAIKPLRVCLDYRYRTSAAGRACLDAFNALSESGETPRRTPDWEAFGRKMMEAWPHGGIEGFELQDEAERHRLIVEVPGGFDPGQHDDGGWGPEPGDPWFLRNYTPAESGETPR
jgi:hypothetical protein